MCENTYVNIQTGDVLDMERVASLKENAMLKVRPDLFDEWDFEKNNELGLDIYKVTKGSEKRAWWICSECESNYDSMIFIRIKGNCQYCTGRRVNYTNSLASLNPDLSSQWHPIRNWRLTPHDVTCSSNKKAWWLGECGHEWESTISSRMSGIGCPFCSGNKVLRGFNDIYTVNKKLSSLLANLSDSYKYTSNSNKRVDWKCSFCGKIIKNKMISKVNKRGLSCPCSDGFSYPEKFMYYLLIQLKIEFTWEKTFTWSQGRRYDFHFIYKDNDYLIEINGEQHYSNAFKGTSSRTLEEEQENDRLKVKLAIENGIEHYIVIDARESDMEYIKNSIKKSGISNIFDLSSIDWFKIEENSISTFVKTACDFWNRGVYSTKEIGKLMNINGNTVQRYLNKGSLLGMCNYTSEKAILYANESTTIRQSRSVICTTTNIVFSSIKEAASSIGVSSSSLRSVCIGEHKTSGGYQWMYKEDYDATLKNNMLINKIPENYYTYKRKVVKLDESLQKIKCFNSITEASLENGLYSKSVINSISACCKGKQRTAIGFRWMYLEDYEKQYGKIDE